MSIAHNQLVHGSMDLCWLKYMMQRLVLLSIHLHNMDPFFFFLIEKHISRGICLSIGPMHKTHYLFDQQNFH